MILANSEKTTRQHPLSGAGRVVLAGIARARPRLDPVLTMGATDAFDTQAEDVSAHGPHLASPRCILAAEVTVASAKEIALEIIQSLPDDCTLEEAAYRLYLRQLVEEAREDFREGRVFTQEELEAEAGKWLEP